MRSDGTLEFKITGAASSTASSGIHTYEIWGQNLDTMRLTVTGVYTGDVDLEARDTYYPRLVEKANAFAAQAAAEYLAENS